jgi:predicted RNA binding protein YcfA (HicA-like mRNA interferase family)
MTRLPLVNFKTMEKVVLSLGFERVRQKGSHVFYRHPDGRTNTAPNHPGRDLSRPLLRVVKTMEQIFSRLNFRVPRAKRKLARAVQGWEHWQALRA